MDFGLQHTPFYTPRCVSQARILTNLGLNPGFMLGTITSHLSQVQPPYPIPVCQKRVLKAFFPPARTD
jgi:hypothetical protein